MRCKQIQSWIGLEADGQLAPDRVPHLERHLLDCEGCRDFRDDLRLGRRLIRATGAGPAEGFEWRLQLRLNNALKEAAGAAAAPWPGVTRPSWRPWFGTFGLSAGFGLAAVLATALFLAPAPTRVLQNAVAENDGFGRRVPVETAVTTPEPEPTGTLDLSRRAVNRPDVRGLSGIQRTVSLPSRGLETGLWQGSTLQVQRLAQENEILRRRLAVAEEHGRMLQARLDSVARRP